MLGARFEEGLRIGGGLRPLFLGGGAADGDILAARDAVGFILVTRDIDRDRHLDLRMQRDRHLVSADHLDRSVQVDLIAGHLDAGFRDHHCDIARRDRAEKLAGFRRLAQHHEGLAVDLSGNLLGFAAVLGIARLELLAHLLKARLVFLGRAQGLALGEQEIAGKAVFDAHGLAHLAELGDAFEQNDFHGLYSFCVDVYSVRDAGGAPATRPRKLKMASARPSMATSNTGQPNTMTAA